MIDRYKPKPKVDKPGSLEKRTCCLCMRAIEPGQRYHVARRKMTMYAHETCMEKEMHRHE